MEFAEIMAKAGMVVKDTVLQACDDYIARECSEAKNRQRNYDIHSAVMAFLDLKVSDADIYKLLQTYFRIESISEASQYIKEAKSSRQIIRLREYMTTGGMTAVAFRDYAVKRDLEGKLKNNPKLLDYSVEKLKAEIEK